MSVMRFGFGLLFLSFTLLISACSSGPSESEFAPKIGDIYTSILHFHPSVYAHKDPEEQRTIGFIISVSMSDPDGFDDITDIYINNKNAGTNWYLLQSSELNSTAECTLEELVVNCSFYSKDRLHDIFLAGYDIVAIDRHGYQSSKSFEFKLPSGEEVDIEEFVYSDEFLGGTGSSAVAGLEVMTIDANDMVFTSDENTLHVEFTSMDERVRDYGLMFYNDASSPEIVGELAFDASLIQNNPIISGDKTSLDIPIDEDSIKIKFFDDKDVSDIYGLHVVLFDQSTPSSQFDVVTEWFNYRGYSEFITLAQ